MFDFLTLVAGGMAIQADGKIVVAGESFIPSTATRDFAVLRYNMDGSLDNTFSADGRLITNSGGIDQGLDAALQPNGKIVAVGQTCNNDFTICNVALARYNPGGALDLTFSGDGKQITDFGGGDNGSFGGIVVTSNKIVVAGYMWNGSDYDFAVYRYLLNGNLDATFSGDGMVNLGYGAGRQDYASDLVIQNDGKIVVVDYTANANDANQNFAVARLNADGSIDTTFSGDGRQITNFGGNDFAMSVALQPNGKMVVAGYKSTSPTMAYVALARYNPGGAPDTTFAGTGQKVFSLVPNKSSAAYDVFVQSDGKIVLIGRTDNGVDSDFAVVGW